jgi:hypothetical protein
MARFPSQAEVEDGVPHERCKESSGAQAAPIESRPPAPVPQPSRGYGRDQRRERDTDNEVDFIRVAVASVGTSPVPQPPWRPLPEPFFTNLLTTPDKTFACRGMWMRIEGKADMQIHPVFTGVSCNF